MKFMLLNSPLYWNSSNVEEDYLPPLGLGYIATYLKKANIDVELVDCVQQRLGVKEVFELLNSEVPDYIGINIFTQNYEIVRTIVEHLPPYSKVIIGGQVVKCIYKEILTWNIVNTTILIIGEGEFIIPDLVKGCCRETPIYINGNMSVYQVNNNSNYFPSSLDGIILDRSIFKNPTTINHYAEVEAPILTSRGCIYNCAFCGGSHNLNKDINVRWRNPESIISEIQDILMFSPNVQSIRVLDDLFLRDFNSVNNAISIFSEFPNMYWRGMAHVVSLKNSLENLHNLRSSGCQELFLGIESGSEKIRKKINKAGTVDQIIRTVTAILETGIDVKGYFMYGLPDESIEDFEETFSLAKKLASISQHSVGTFRTSVFQFRPYHGTQLYNELVDTGYTIKPITTNNSINTLKGRTQFNFHSGNYSAAPDDVLNNFIIKTQLLSEG